MAVIIAHKIKREEFKKGIISPSDLKIILGSFQKGVFTVIKGEHLPKGSRLIKVYSTSVSGARRVVFVVDVANNDAFLMFYRSKKDKIGKNISIQNQDFRKLLHAYLNLLNDDLETGDIDVHEV